jgi:hypothetical protein
MKNYRIVPLSKQFATNIRRLGRDAFGHEVIEQTANGHGPCRVSLKPFVPGKDKRLLLSHSPFEINNAFNQPGPIFIHKEEVEPYDDIYRFPPEIKANKHHFPLSLIGYNLAQEMIFTKLVGDHDVDELISMIFSKYPDIEFLHARNAQAGCYICKIERNR